MKKGDKVRIISGTGHPLRGKDRGPAAIALAFGGVPAGEHALIDYIEEDATGAPRRTFKWVFEADQLVVLPGCPPMTVDAVARHCADAAWRAANPAHPLAIICLFFEQILAMEERAKTWRPGLKIANGDSWAILGPDMPEEEKQRITEKLASGS